MTAPAEGELLQQVLSSFRDEWKQHEDLWKMLDTKAQGATAIAGIFIAGASAVARAVPSGASQPFKGALVLAVALLVIAAVLAVLALWVRSFVTPPRGEPFAKLVHDYLRVRKPEDAAERWDLVSRDQIELWEICIKSLRQTNASKARLLRGAQAFLAAAAVAFAGLTIWSVVTPTT